jgi:DNA-binding NarL/FixJ family response regulator
MSSIIIAAPDPILTKALVLLIKNRMPLVECLDCASWDNLVLYIHDYCPDILIIDWELIDFNPGIVMQEIHLECPDSAIIVMSINLETLHQSFQMGADDFILKSSSPEHVTQLLKLYLPARQCEP